jgi:hypothetical protein
VVKVVVSRNGSGRSKMNLSKLTYIELLLREEWKEKRNLIVKRDKYLCKGCFNAKVVSGLTKSFLSYIPYPFSGCVICHIIPTDEVKSVIISRSLIEKVSYNHQAIIYFSNNVEGKIFAQSIRKPTLEEAEEYYFKDSRLLLEFEDIKKLIWINTVKGLHDEVKILKQKYPYSNAKDFINSFNITDIKIVHDGHVDWVHSFGLNVHHKYYQEDKLPWEYPDHSLETYCQQCHHDLHSTMKVLHYNKSGVQIGELTPCFKCGGAGHLPEYMHVDNGVCYDCSGKRFIEMI